NIATGYSIEMSTDPGPDKVFTPVATAPSRSGALAVGGLSPATTYYYRIFAINGLGSSLASNVASVTTPIQQALNLDFGGGFGSAGTLLKYNGSAVLKNGKAELTTGMTNQAGSVFSSSRVNISGFSTQFTFQLSSGSTTADGFTFTLQNNSPTVRGTTGGGL